MFDLITIGDVVIDTSVRLQDAKVEVLDGQRMLSVRFGDKVVVECPASRIGGNAANSAVGGARLKMKTAIYTNVGDDHNSSLILKQFKEEKVDPRYVVVSKKYPTNHNIILEFKDDRTILIYHQPWEYNLPELESSKWLYFTSLSPSFPESDIVNQVVQYLERTGAKLTFNPGTFQIKHGVRKYPRLLSLTELFILNKEEAKLVLGHKESEKIPPKKLLQAIADLGPKNVIITDGLAGSYGFDGEKFYQLPIFPSTIVQRTGAGDAFATGVTAALFYGKTLDEAMKWGTANGAAVVESLGPEEGLLNYNQMQEMLKEHSKILIKEI